ncbi:MAG: calcium-binding protein [Planctomycetaceae bacterium]|nr:calcium-binding protein [Planctomycetaceae bacterium]
MPKETMKKASKTTKKATKNEATVSRMTKNDPEREKRIDYEIVVDAYDEYERAMGWYYSLQDTIEGQARCRCSKPRSMSPLEVGEEVDIIEMAPLDDCMKEMFVVVSWNERKLAVPLSQLEPIDGDEKAVEIIEDWLYWCLMGYQF